MNKSLHSLWNLGTPRSHGLWRLGLAVWSQSMFYGERSFIYWLLQCIIYLLKKTPHMVQQQLLFASPLSDQNTIPAWVITHFDFTVFSSEVFTLHCWERSGALLANTIVSSGGSTTCLKALVSRVIRNEKDLCLKNSVEALRDKRQKY